LTQKAQKHIFKTRLGENIYVPLILTERKYALDNLGNFISSKRFKLISLLKQNPWKIKVPHNIFPIGKYVLKSGKELAQSTIKNC
jgi:hypothetical protein